MSSSSEPRGFDRVPWKGVLFFAAGVLVGGAFLSLRVRTKPSDMDVQGSRNVISAPAATESEKPTPLPETLARTMEPQEVFRRALWRRSSAGDMIHHAERREWADAGGVTRWEWFLIITPGPSLEAWLTANPFSLRKVTKPRAKDAANWEEIPEWFPREFEGMELFQGQTGNLLMAREPGSNRIFLSDWGGGLTRPVEP